MTLSTVTSAFGRAVAFVRPGGGRLVLGQSHVPLLVLMAPAAAATHAVGSVPRR
ncbi:hypothetical protein [Mycobacterium sp. NPDC006124]|uniref:hypothetical protein n=1 Tax=Mycobacterium sp. NPDC006124 TaxID=3156729 RepID=UPI0033B7F870